MPMQHIACSSAESHIKEVSVKLHNTHTQVHLVCQTQHLVVGLQIRF